MRGVELGGGDPGPGPRERSIAFERATGQRDDAREQQMRRNLTIVGCDW
jgi:hypothetical protein